MTEAEWLVCTDPQPMLAFLRGKASDRKVRLFGCGYLRLIWQQLDGQEGSRQAIDVSERYADGEATRNELRRARKTAEKTAEAWSDPALKEPVWQAVDTTSDNAWAFYERVHYETTAELSEPDIVIPRTWKLVKEREAIRHGLYVHLLRDLFGNPFRPMSAAPSWFTPPIINLAQQIYDERTFDRMPILADALKEAGCTNPDILSHCRGPGEHVRGCWVVDLLLGKE